MSVADKRQFDPLGYASIYFFSVNRFATRPIRLSLILGLAGVLLAVGSCARDEAEPDPGADLPEIEERGTVRAITSYGPLSYFIYRGEPLGFDYELVGRFADSLGLELDIIPAYDIAEMLDLLESGEGDLIAYRLSVTSDRRERVEFSDTVASTRQVLVQPKPDDWREVPRHITERRLIRRPYELAGREVHVRAASAYVSRLENLAREIGDPIDIVEAPRDVTTEQLIEAVHKGEVPLTVADENIARITASYYRDVDVETPISLVQRTAWAVRPGSTELLSRINEWLAAEREHADFNVIYRRYFDTPRAFRSRLDDSAFSSVGGSISPWDDIFREVAREIEWDWRLLAALAYQESRFNPNARSWAGAVGVMQLMPATARQHGAGSPTDPRQSIEAGARYLLWLDETWTREIDDDETRLRFVLASYNVGRGHVQDARRLAEYYGDDPDSWESVADYLVRKMEPEYYNHEVVHFGYARGTEPVQYVRNILRLYRHYVRFTDDNGIDTTTEAPEPSRERADISQP